MRTPNYHAGKSAFLIPGEPPRQQADGKIKAFAANTDMYQLTYAWTPSDHHGVSMHLTLCVD